MKESEQGSVSVVSASPAASEQSIPFTMWRAAVLISSQSFMVGYVFACLNSCLVAGNNNDASDCYNHTDSSCPTGTIYNDLDLSLFEAQLATSLALVGAWIGSVGGSTPSEVYGRRFTILANNSFFMVGAILSASGNLYTLLIGRFVSGIAVGVGSVIAPVLLSEIATNETRGAITLVHQVMITGAIFVAAVVGYIFVSFVQHGWQYVQAFALLPSLVVLLLQFYVPESPKWILSGAISLRGQGDSASNLQKESEARQRAAETLRPLRPGGHDIDREIASVVDEICRELESNSNVTWEEVFKHKKSLIIGCALMCYQVMTGVNTVNFYSSTIFSLAGFSQNIIGTVIFSGINFVSSIASSRFVDRTGRRVFLLGGAYTMMIFLVILSSLLLAPIASLVQGIMAVICILCFGLGAVAYGAVCWVVISEIMPTRLRVKAVSLFLSINWISNIVIGFLTLTAIDGLGNVQSNRDDDSVKNDEEKKGVAYMYFIFAGICATCCAFIHLYVPETKDFLKQSTPLLRAPDL